MPPDPLYTAGSPYHQRRRWTAPHTVRCLEAAITLMGKPDSLLDLGCGEGKLVASALMRGIDAVGVDVAVQPNSVGTSAVDGLWNAALINADLQEPLDLGRRFDWVLCWEVGEHLPERAAAGLVETCVRHMAPNGRVIFTAARVGQRGPGHINCRQPWWWSEHFAGHGLTVAVDLSADLRRAWLACAPRCPYYGQNAQVFWRIA